MKYDFLIPNDPFSGRIETEIGLQNSGDCLHTLAFSLITWSYQKLTNNMLLGLKIDFSDHVITYRLILNLEFCVS